jgi:hypothetical protein
LAVLKLELTLPRILGKRDPLHLAVDRGAPITVHDGADFRPWPSESAWERPAGSQKLRRDSVKMTTGQGAE